MTTHNEVEEQALRCEEHAEQCHDAGALGWRDTFNEAAALIRRLRAERDAARLVGKIEGMEEAIRIMDEAIVHGPDLTEEEQEDFLTVFHHTMICANEQYKSDIRAKIAELEATTTPASPGSSDQA